MRKQHLLVLLLYVLIVVAGLVVLGFLLAFLHMSGVWQQFDSYFGPPSWLTVALVISLGYFALSILQAAWVVRDGRNRGMDGTAVWGLGTLFLGLPAFLVYLFSRPSGQLALCDHCFRWKLDFAKRCPHCQKKH